MSKNSWFKHYNNAHEGHTLRSLWDSQDYEACCFFWILHELISQFETPDTRGEVRFNWRTFARATGWKPSKCLRVLSRICSVSEIEMNDESNGTADGYVTVLSPKWLELQETRGGKRFSKNEQSSSKTQTDIRSKNKEERKKNKDTELEGSAPSDSDESSIAEVAEVISELSDVRGILLERQVTYAQQKAILTAYPEPLWVMGEIRKMIAWESTNPGKKKKAFARFANNWLARAWDGRRHASTNRSTNWAETRDADNAAALVEAKKLMGEL